MPPPFHTPPSQPRPHTQPPTQQHATINSNTPARDTNDQNEPQEWAGRLRGFSFCEPDSTQQLSGPRRQLVMRLHPHPAVRIHASSSGARSTQHRTTPYRDLGTSDEDSDDAVLSDSMSDNAREPRSAAVPRRPGGVMKPHLQQRDGRGRLVFVCCPGGHENDDEEEGEGEGNVAGDEGVGEENPGME